MILKDKMKRAADLRELRRAYGLYLDDVNHYQNAHCYHRLRNFCLNEYGESEVVSALNCVNDERKRKEMPYAELPFLWD